jgi:phage host-nuclease inhibitor protein Gam
MNEWIWHLQCLGCKHSWDAPFLMTCPQCGSGAVEVASVSTQSEMEIVKSTEKEAPTIAELAAEIEKLQERVRYLERKTADKGINY